jgi:hypothetical protein
VPRVGAEPNRAPKLLVQGFDGLAVMALASALPSGGTTSLLLEREAQVSALQALADAAQEGGGRLIESERRLPKGLQKGYFCWLGRRRVMCSATDRPVR